MLKAGITRGDITPPQGLELVGYPHYPRHNTGFHDPLHATCMYLNSNGVEAVMVTLDLLYIGKKYVKQIRENVEKACGIPGKHIMFTCTHTHSGPITYGALHTVPATDDKPEAYVADLVNIITKCIVDAKSDAFDAEFTCAIGRCGAESGAGGNRRTPGGPHDPSVNVLAVREKGGMLRGAIVNYSLHPTFIHEWSTVCTADYPNYLKLEIEETYPGVLTGFAQGTSGNQSSRYYRTGESYDEAERVGRTIGKAAVAALESAVWTDNLPIKVASTEMEFETRSFGTEEALMAQVEHDRAIYEDLYARYGKSEKREEYYLWQNANLKLLGSENQLNYVRQHKDGVSFDPTEAPAELMEIVLGDALVAAIPGEAFVEYGLYFKAMAGFGKVILNTVSNGCLPGYMYTPEALCYGGYETDTSSLDKNFGRHLVENLLDLANSLQ